MSYAAKGEKIFAYQDPVYPDCTPETIKRSDHRLKRFLSTFDRRAWHVCEELRYRHLYELMSGSRTCLGTDHCHRYVPLEDLLKILMGEKDRQLKQMQERLQGGGGENDKLQSKVQEMTNEVNRSRDLLAQAMHKLQNIDEVVNENKKLQCRLRCSEERVRYLEEKKKHLESELAELRSKSQIQIDLEKAQQMLHKVTQQREESTEMDEVVLQSLSAERTELQEKVKTLEKELVEAKKKEAEIEMLKKQSQSDSLDKEEMREENECYRRKLASMKCLEKQILELKKQGRALADKYKRESQKAAEQMKRMCQAAKELQCIREERDSLRKRVNELASYECQYNKLQRKLQCVDAVIAENENLNSKLVALQKLEKENEYLKCRLESIQEMEASAAEDKEKIMQLRCAVADQEEEMKDLLCQIERLTSGKHEEELERLKSELYEKNCKLKLCEEQLAEVPMLEAEIDDLRTRLQCCCQEFSSMKRGESSNENADVSFPASSTGIRTNYKGADQKNSSVVGGRREEKLGLRDKVKSCQEITQKDPKTWKMPSFFFDKREMSCEEVQSLLQSSKGIISCVLEDMIEHQKEMEELEMCNRAMKEEIETLKSKVGSSDKDSLLQEVCNLKRALEEKNAELCKLRQGVGGGQDCEEVESLRELNYQMKAELQAACLGLKQVADLENLLEEERRARCEAESRLREQGASSEAAGKASSEDPDSDCCKNLQKEIEDLKLQIKALNALTEELKKENELLRELQKPCPDFSKELDEKCALENLLSLLQAELDAFKGQKLSNECEALRNELKRVMEQNCQLKTLVDCYRQRLNLEKQSNELMQTSSMKKSEDKDKEQKNAYVQVKGEEEQAKKVETPTSVAGAVVPASGAGAATVSVPGAMNGPTEEMRQNCEEELKALRNDLAQAQQENKNLKNSLQETEQKLKGVAGPDDLLKQLEAENAEKLKKLMEQHEKELAERDKKCNDNLNAMKAGYETDIRKLTERHKASMMRLQGLHEDEVNELNTNYETQLETMQTQSEEAISDVARGSAAKLRQLAEKHAREMKMMEAKLGEAEGNLNQSKEDLRRAKEDAEGIAAQIRARLSREKQKMWRGSQQKVNSMRGSYEAERKKDQEELDSLRKKLKELEANGGVCDCKSAKKKPCKVRDPTCPLDFNDVIQKILEQGMDSLTFNEIALVHRKACCALEGIMMNSKVCPSLEPPVGDSCPHTPLLEADKQQLLSKIFALENVIQQKQRQTQEAIINMEMAIKKERCRLQELKSSLQNEQQKNSELKVLLNSQSKVETDLKKERDRLENQASFHQSLSEQKSRQLDEEIRNKKCLEAEVEMLKSQLKQLCMTMNSERGGSDCKQTNQVELMRVKLEQSLNQERRLVLQLKNEAKYRMQLECQLQALRQSFKQMVNLPAVDNGNDVLQNPLEAKIVKERQNLDQIKEKKNKIKTKSTKKHKK